jgi:serine/threonine-protein kinase
MPSTVATEERDDRLARLLSELTEKQRLGQRADIDSLAVANPDLAEELRSLWAAAQFAEEFTRTPRIERPAPTLLTRTPEKEFGDFELHQEIGRGGMGVVYKAWQKSLRRPVALKMILRGDYATPADLARFQVESQAAAHLQHPNIVPVYAAGEQDGQAWFCMRYVEGETLATLLSRGPLRAHEAATILSAICRGVDYAHKQGILHRDLKPSNILLDSKGVPHITDFGLAKRVRTVGNDATKLTNSGAIIGTPAYMAPEQVSGKRGTLCPASDVYSLGVILYEMLTGRPPFQAPTPVDTLFLVLDQDPVRPALLNPKVDPDLELICLKCLQKEPELRYASAGELADDLDAYLHGEQLSIRRTRLVDLRNFFSLLRRETHHAVVLENWGVLWMCHSLKILFQCILTTVLAWNGVTNPLVYLALWGGGLIAWGAIFWRLRKRAGPILFIERQIAHVWAAAVLATIGTFVLEMLLDFPVLSLAPFLAIIAGTTFVAKAGMLSGAFYVSAAAMFAITIPMAMWPDYGVLLFGALTAVCFFVPGLKYYRQRTRRLREEIT